MGKIILFIGAYDKTDMLFYIGKVLSTNNHRVLLVDMTSNQDYEYVYQKIQGTSGILQHDNLDIIENVIDYKHLIANTLGQEYDFILVDIDREEALHNWPEADHYFLVTSYDNRSVKGNEKLLESFFRERQKSELLPMYRIINEVNATFTEEYLDELYDKFPIDWKTDFIFYPDERDMKLKIRNQHLSHTILKGLSKDYKEVLKQVAGVIMDNDLKSMSLIFKQAERG